MGYRGPTPISSSQRSEDKGALATDLVVHEQHGIGVHARAALRFIARERLMGDPIYSTLG